MELELSQCSNVVVLNLDESKPQENLPLITIGVVVFNREWIIKKMLASLQSQTYPHNKIFVLVVDGESKDNTVKFTKEVLAESDFNDYEVIVKKSNIPEARNICIQNMKGDFLLFWDSDVIMEQTTISRLMENMKKTEAGIVSAASIQTLFFKTSKEITDFPKFNEPQQKENLVLTSTAGMGLTLISKKVINSVTFDSTLTSGEDDDFSVSTREKNFKIIADTSIHGFDVNVNREKQSDIHVDMPLQHAMSNIRKKSRAQAFGSTLNPTYKFFLTFFLKYKRRYAYYLGYIPMLITLILGVLTKNLYLLMIFPIYLSLYSFLQFKNRGIKKGCKAIMRSFLVGIPTAIFIVYYLIKRVDNSKYSYLKEHE